MRFGQNTSERGPDAALELFPSALAEALHEHVETEQEHTGLRARRNTHGAGCKLERLQGWGRMRREGGWVGGEWGGGGVGGVVCGGGKASAHPH